MTIMINGDVVELGSGATVEQAVARVTDAGTGVAVAVNDAVVPRGAWSSTRLRPDDRVEILTAVQGG